MACYGFFADLIIPKWLINDPGHIPILFGSLLELPKCSPNLAPYTPYKLFITKILQTIQEHIKAFLNVFFFISQHFGNP